MIPVIDLGVLIEPNDAGGYDSFDGRVTVVQPGYPVSGLPQADRHPAHVRGVSAAQRPVRFEEYRRAGYVTGGDDPSPVVVTFTTETATMAVNEFMHRLTGYRGENGHCAERVRRFDRVKDADSVPGGLRRPECSLCGRRKYDGRGDMNAVSGPELMPPCRSRSSNGSSGCPGCVGRVPGRRLGRAACRGRVAP